ncbi:MAG: hypothetical protein ACK52I_16275 [Pseudomonadota bacterium]
MGKKKKGSSSSTDHLPPFVTGSDGERRILFWFSWDAAAATAQHVHEYNQPDIDFQLNPWTLHNLLSHGKKEKYEDDEVSVFIFIYIFILFFLLVNY